MSGRPRIAILQGSSQKDKNPILESCARECLDPKKYEILNFGVFPEEDAKVSYVQTAICAALLLVSGAVDFVITGCSSGQGMMLAMNALPGVVCGYVKDPADAYLFGRINNGNAISYPLGLNFGWAGEINLKSTLTALFSEPFGVGYPAGDAERKRRDTRRIGEIRRLSQRPLDRVLPELDGELLEGVLSRRSVCQCVMRDGKDEALRAALSVLMEKRTRQ